MPWLAYAIGYGYGTCNVLFSKRTSNFKTAKHPIAMQSKAKQS